MDGSVSLQPSKVILVSQYFSIAKAPRRPAGQATLREGRGSFCRQLTRPYGMVNVQLCVRVWERRIGRSDRSHLFMAFSL